EDEMCISSDRYPWYALHVRSQHEKIVASTLRGKGYEQFLPLYRTKHRWSDRMKVIERPLFPGYVFCRFDLQKRLPILVTPGVLLIVGVRKTPLPVVESEISALQSIVNS